MELSSEDGSFVWTDASNSSSSEDMVKNPAGGISGGEESENGKTYKKKLHKELFTKENGNSVNESKVRNKKRKRERNTSESEHSETARKKIKVEPESDLDVARVHHSYSGDTELNGYYEHLLDEKVKKEQEFLLPSEKIKKNKRKRSASSENINIDVKLDPVLKRTEKKLSNECNTEDSSSMFIYDASDHPDEYITKKKKKKKKSEKREEAPNVQETDDNHNQNVDPHISISNKSRKKETVHEEKHSTEDKSRDWDITSRDLTVDSTTADISAISKISYVNMTQEEPLTVENNKDQRRLSERIQFEDDVVDSGSRRDGLVVESLARPKKPSDKLQRFLVKNNKLRPCAVRDPTDFTIGESDEVWVVTCPSDVDVTAFTGRSLELDGRCKVKLQGAAYEGGAAGAGAGGEARAALFVGARLRCVSLGGRLALHRRVPRAPPAAPPAPAPAAAAARAARVPLPDTKLRHPLLGAHYKKALKLPATVSERLRGAPPPAPAPAPAARSHKRRRKSEAPRALSPTEASTPVPSKKKAKRKKHDLEAAETWESERAIEESLFDF